MTAAARAFRPTTLPVPVPTLRLAVDRGAQESVETNHLVARHLSGDALAFGELMERYHGRLLNFTSRMVGDRECAEDLVQEAFFRVSRHLHRFDTNRKFSTWVYTIVSNLAKNELRRQRRSPLVLFSSVSATDDDDRGPMQFADCRGRPDDMLTARYHADLVQATLARLPLLYREVLVLRELEGLSYDEICGRLGCRLGAVKSRLHRARITFMALVAPHLD
jgi:RNA polymerase sigma-70 factor (ECF subfamily)